MKNSTRCVQIDKDDPFGAISPPIYQTATFAQPSATEFGEYDYTRSGNPTRTQLEKKLAKLEKGNFAAAFSSGMAAITAISRLLETGDGIIASDDLYGGCVRLLEQVLPRQGITVQYVDMTDLDALRAAFNAKTKLVMLETPTNPFIKVADIKAIADLAHANGALLSVDNTMLSPILQNPLELGADIVIHSATKALCGHSDVMAGTVVVNGEDIYKKIAFVQNAEGAALSPFDSWLLLRGLKTLALRVEHQSRSARTVADFLANHPAVKEVFYPEFESNPGYEVHKRQATGGGNVISFTTGSTEASKQIVEALELFPTAVSFGSVNSTASMPCFMSHASVPAQLRDRLAPPPDLIRLSIGIEDVEDIIEDLQQALVIPNAATA